MKILEILFAVMFIVLSCMLMIFVSKDNDQHLDKCPTFLGCTIPE